MSEKKYYLSVLLVIIATTCTVYVILWWQICVFYEIFSGSWFHGTSPV